MKSSKSKSYWRLGQFNTNWDFISPFSCGAGVGLVAAVPSARRPVRVVAGTSGLEPGSGQCRGGGETMDTSDREQDTNTSNYTTNITSFIKVSRKLNREENIQKCFQSSYTEYCQLLWHLQTVRLFSGLVDMCQETISENYLKWNFFNI